MTTKNGVSRSWRSVLPELYEAHPDWKASQIHERLILMYGDKAPGLSSVQKQLTPIHVRDEERKATGLDVPWHLGLMADKPEYNTIMSADAVFHIGIVQHWAAHNADSIMHLAPGPVTVRHAIWIARVYRSVVGNFFYDKKIKPKDIRLIVEKLWRWSLTYATHEIICKLSGVPMDTSALDEALRIGASPIVLGNQYSLFYPDGSIEVDPETAKQLDKTEKDGDK